MLPRRVLGGIQGCTDAHQETQDLWVIVATEVAELTDGGSGGAVGQPYRRDLRGRPGGHSLVPVPQVSAPLR